MLDDFEQVGGMLQVEDFRNGVGLGANSLGHQETAADRDAERAQNTLQRLGFLQSPVEHQEEHVVNVAQFEIDLKKIVKLN